MKKIVPFNNVLTFNTDVHEITAISLEHDIEKESNAVSGVFFISGEYKITDALLEKENFNFELPFDIALSDDYNIDTLVVDIDDFRYELIDKNKLKINIDLYIDGEIIEHNEEDHNNIETKEDNLFTEEEIRELTEENIPSKENIDASIEEDREEKIKEETEIKNKVPEEPTLIEIQERLDLLDEMLKNNKEESMKEETENNINIENTNTNDNINIFNGFNEDEQYVTYRVYRVLDTDTLDKILEKYNVTKEELSKYNNIEEIHSGDKLIIPANNK